MRVRYQRGYLRLGRRENGPDCWEFLWRDSELDRKPARRKAVIIQMWKIPGRLATIFVCLSMKHVLINPFCEPVCGALRRVRFRRYSVGTKQLAMSSDDGHQVAPGERQSLPCRTRYQVHTSKVCLQGKNILPVGKGQVGAQPVPGRFEIDGIPIRTEASGRRIRHHPRWFATVPISRRRADRQAPF